MATPVIAPEPLNVSPFEGDDTPTPAPEPTPTPEKPAEPAPEKPAPKDDSADIRREMAELRRTNAELAASERYWADKARAGKNNGYESEEPEPQIEPIKKLSAAESVDRFTEQGVDFIFEEARRRGFITKEDIPSATRPVIEQVVEKTRGKMTVEDRISRDFPDLLDGSTELFRATQKIYQARVREDPALRESGVALLMAAELAKLQLQAKAPPKKVKADYRDDEGDGDKESVNDRRRRIASQQGDLGRSSGTPFEGDDDDLGPEHREVLNLFARAGVTEADYRAQRARDRGRR